MKLKSIGFVLAAAALAIPLAACGGRDNSASITTTVTETRTTTTIPETETTTTEARSETTATPPPAAAAPAIMPNVVCMNLQAAQDEIQNAGVFFSRSEDATGAGRSQILDRNWIVVAQTPAPGAQVTEGQAVLSAVKIGEPNQC